MDILSKATVAIALTGQIEENVDIAIEHGLIVELGSELHKKYPAAKVHDLTGKLVVPGLVCGHNHFYSGLARGIMADIKPSPDFISVLKNLWWKLDRALDEESLYYSGIICSLEAIRSGCSAVIDHHASPNFIHGSLDVLKQGFQAAGLRAMTCFETTDRNGGFKELEAGVAENLRFAASIDEDRQQNPDSYLVEAHIGAHAPFTVSNEGLELLADAVSQSQRGLHIHVAEDLYDASHSHHHYGQDLLERLDQFGLLNHKTIIAHGLHLSNQDIQLLNKRDGFLVHNARSNMNNNVGYCQTLESFKNVALGTDGIGADMFEELKFAYFKHKDSGGPLWPDSFLRYLSQGNEILARNFSAKFGEISPGFKADLTVLDYRSPTPFCAGNMAGHFAFGLNASAVDSVMINGRFVYQDRSFPLELERIYSEAQKSAKRLWERMDSL